MQIVQLHTCDRYSIFNSIPFLLRFCGLAVFWHRSATVCWLPAPDDCETGAYGRPPSVIWGLLHTAYDRWLCERQGRWRYCAPVGELVTLINQPLDSGLSAINYQGASADTPPRRDQLRSTCIYSGTELLQLLSKHLPDIICFNGVPSDTVHYDGLSHVSQDRMVSPSVYHPPTAAPRPRDASL